MKQAGNNGDVCETKQTNFGPDGRTKFMQPCKFVINGTNFRETLKLGTLLFTEREKQEQVDNG